jgi:hypothetical protein
LICWLQFEQVLVTVEGVVAVAAAAEVLVVPLVLVKAMQMLEKHSSQL